MCYAYVYIILVYWSTWQEIFDRTGEVISLLKQENIKLGGLKCNFGLAKEFVLGGVVCNGTVFPHRTNCKGETLKWPGTIGKVHTLYGIMSYLQSHIEKFSIISRSIANLLKSKSDYVFWSEECE